MDSLATLPKALVHPNRAPRPLLISACYLFEGFSRAVGNRALRTVPSPLSPSTCPNLIQSGLVTRSYEPLQWGTSLSIFRHSGDTVYAAKCLAWRHDDLVDIHRMARRDPSRPALCVAYGAPFSHGQAFSRGWWGSLLCALARRLFARFRPNVTSSRGECCPILPNCLSPKSSIVHGPLDCRMVASASRETLWSLACAGGKVSWEVNEYGGGEQHGSLWRPL